MRAASFTADITPPTGQPLCSLVPDFVPQADTIESPLLAKGVVLESVSGRIVLATLDWTALLNSSHDFLCRAIGKAAGCESSRVLLHCVHQHTAPMVDVEALRLMPGENRRAMAQQACLERTQSLLAEAVQEASLRMHPVRSVEYQNSIVERVASNRRVRQGDGSIATRWSLCWQEELREAPEGVIDPQLDCIRLVGDSGLIACLHFFACHPQTSSGGGRVFWDVPGIARERLEHEIGATQIYFTGCAGDITMGKYNSGTAEEREALAERLHAGMHRAATRAPMISETDGCLRIDHRALPFAERHDAGHTEKEILSRMESATAPQQAELAALELAAVRYRREGNPIAATSLAFGKIRTLHLPGEPMIHFQIFARKASGAKPVCVAGYANGNPFYYGPDSIFSDRGGYEQTAAFAAPCQNIVEAAIKDLLQEVG